VSITDLLLYVPRSVKTRECAF